MKILDKVITLIAIVAMLPATAQTTATVSGNWNNTVTWGGNPVPTSGDVIISDGVEVIFNANHNTANSVTISSLDIQGTGILVFPYSDDTELDNNFVLTVTGTVDVAASASIVSREGDSGTTLPGLSTSRTHTVNFEGNITNEGTIALGETPSAYPINIDWQTNDFTISGGGTTTFYDVDLEAGTAMDVNEVTVTTTGTLNIERTIDLLDFTTLIINTAIGTVNFGSSTTNQAAAFELEGQNTTLTITDGTVNVDANNSTNNQQVFLVDGLTATVNVNGGNLNIGDVTTLGEGRFRINNVATDFAFNQTAGSVNIADMIDFQSVTASMDLDISDGTFNVGTNELGNESNSEFLNGSLTMTGGVLEFGNNLNLDALPALSGGATFSVGTAPGFDTDFQVDFGDWTITSDFNFSADGGLDILAGSSITVQTGATLNIEQEATTDPNNALQVFGTLTIDGGTVNVATNVLTNFDTDLVQIEDGGTINLNDGTFNVATGLTDGAQIVSQNLLQFDETTSTMTVGDGDGTAATLNVGTSIVAQVSPVEEDLIVILGDESSLVINSDGEVNVGGGNIGSVLLGADANDTNTTDLNIQVNGGTLNISGTLDMRNGTIFQMSDGVTNIGVSASGGLNDINFGANDPTAPMIFEMTGGTLTVGDGASLIIIGNGNNSPAYGTTTAYHELEISGGTFNLNGRLRLREQNARLVLGGGATVNVDPQGENNADPDGNLIILEAGIVDITGVVNFNFIDPHNATGIGEVFTINAPGNTLNNVITGSYDGIGTDAIDFSTVTWGFGDGASNTSSVDGFDLNLATGHTNYGNWVINNPSGSNRAVSFINGGNDYLVGDVTISAGTLNLGTNDFDDDATEGTFTVGSAGILELDTDFPGQNADAFGTYLFTTGSTVAYTGAGTITNGQVPDGTAFSNLIVSGGGTVNFSGAAAVADTVFLTSGVLAASTNLTPQTDAVISRSNGSISGTLQGSNAYIVRYTGTSKSIDAGVDGEWTGSGNQSLVIDLDAAETMTFTNTALGLVDLSILAGEMTDGGLTHTVSGGLTVNDTYSGTGSISLTGGVASHTLNTSGTATISNLIMDDANGASGNLDVLITNSMTLTNGILDVGSGAFTLSSGASITGGSATTFVAFDGASSSGGMVQTFSSATDAKTFPIGTNTQYTPFTMDLNAASSFGALTVLPVTGGSQFTLDGSNTLDIDYYWLVNDGNNFSDVNADFSYTYDDSDIRGAEGNYIAARYDVANPEWTTSDETTDVTDGVASNVVTLKGVEFSDGHFTAGEEDEFSGVITTFYLISGVSDHDWDNGAHWTNTDGGSTAINRTPGTNSPVVIGGDDVTVDSDGQNAGSLTIESDGTVIISENAGTPTSGHSFGTVSGTGTLIIESADTDAPTFPNENGANWSDFLSASGGTVIYRGDGTYTIPTNGGTYNNLTVTSTSAASTKNLPDEDLSISGDFAISGGFGTTAAFSDATNGDVSVLGQVTVASGDVLAFGATNNRTVSISGDVITEGTINVANSGTATHNLTISSSLISNGTFDMNTGGSTVATTFNGTSNASVTGSGSVDFDRLIVNMGSSAATNLTVDVSTFSVTDQGDGASESSIAFQNGNLIIATAGTVVLSNNGDVSIPATAALTLDSGSPTFGLETSNAGNLLLNGGLTINSGTFNVGNVGDFSTENSIRYDGTEAALTVNNATLNVGGAIRPAVTDASAALAFSLINDGIVSLARNVSTNQDNVQSVINRAEGDFVLDNAASSFTMTGANSILEVVRAESNDGKAFSITSAVTNYTVTGGTVKVLQDAHDAFSSNATNTSNDVTVYSSVPFYNLEIGDGDYEGDFGGPDSNVATELDLQVINDLTINLNDATSGNGKFEFYRADQGNAGNNDEWNVIVGGNFTVTDGNILVADGGDGGTLTFNGSGTQVLTTNGETLGDITMNNTGTLQLADPLTISGDWTYTQGTLDQNGQGITMSTPIGLQSTTISGDALFDDLTLSNTSGVSQASGTTTISGSGTLTIADDVIYDLGDNGLIIANQAGGINFSATPDATNMIRLSGTDAAAGLTLTYPNSTTSGFIFPVGATINATDYYLPGQIDLTAGGGAGATANLVLIASQHPQVTASQNALNLYWSVTPAGFNGSQTTTHTYDYGLVNADLIEGADDTNFLDAVNAGSPTFNWTEGSTTNVAAQAITFTNPGSDNIAGDFTAGVDAAFNAVTVFYTIRDGDWDNTLTTTTPWTNDECAAGGRTEVTGLVPATGDPVVICAGNTVTITTATGLEASSVEINGTLNSQIADISTVNDISGTGTLAFDHTTATTPVFGTLASSFITGGTLDFGGTMAYTLPTTTNYHNLILSNDAGLTLANDIAITGDVTLSGSSLTMNSFTITDTDGDGVFTAGANADMTIDGATNFPTGFGTYSLDATSNTNFQFNNGGQTIPGGITYGNLILNRTGNDPATRTLTGNIVIAGDLSINRRSELAASTFDIDIRGNWTMSTLNETNFDPGTGTVTFSGSGDQTLTFSSGAESEAFYNLTLNKSGGTLTFPTNVNDVTVQNTLTITDGTLQMDDVELIADGPVNIASGAVLTSNTTIDLNGDFDNAGIFTVPNTVTLAGNFNNTGTYTTTNNTLVFDNTTTAQSLTGATTFNNLTLAKASGVDVTLNNAVTIEGTLALQNEGNVVLSSGDLTIADGGVISGNAGGSAVGDFSATRMIRTDGTGSAPALVKNADDSDVDWDLVFPIGVDNGGSEVYTPVIVAATTDQIATTGTLSVRSINGATTDQSISSSATTLNRHFHLDVTGIGGAVTFDLLFQYDNGDVQGSESDYNAAYSERGTDDGWNQPVASVTNVSAGNNQFGASVTLDGTLDFSAPINTEWIAGDNDLLFPRFFTRAGGGVDCSLGCDWNDGTNWTLDDGGTTSAGSIPGADNGVTISVGHTMTMDNNTNTAQSVVLDGTLDIAATTGHTLGEITGAGVLEIDAGGLENYVDAGSGSTFFGENGGTVSYLGDAAYTLPTAFTEYNNLIIGGSTQDTHDKSLGIGLTVFGNLTLGTTDLENSGNLSLELRGNFTSSGGNFNVADGTFIFSNTATASLPGNLTFGSAGSLTLDNFGEKDLTGGLVIENLTINSSSGTFDANSNSITITGNWDNQASSSLLSNPGTVTFNGADAQQIDGDNTFAAVNVNTTSTVVTVGSGTQTFTGAVTLATGTTLDLGTNTIRVGNTLDVDQGTFTGTSGRVVFTSTSDPEVQTDAITVNTLEIDKGASTNTFDNDPATVTFDNLVITSGEYDGPDVDLNLTGSLSIASGAVFNITGISNMDINGGFSVANTLDLSGLATMNIAGDFTNDGTFSPPPSVTFDGASDQTISGSSTTAFSILNLNNTAAGSTDLTLNANVTISNYFDFQEGIVSVGTGSLTFNDNATVRYDGVAETTPAGGANDGNSFVSGPVSKIGDDDFVFPIGDGTRYARLGIQPQTGAATDQYTGEYLFSASATATGTKGGTIVRVSGLEHWDLTRDNGSTSVIPTLFYDGTSEVDETSTLLVAHYTGTEWEDLGNGAVSASTITAASAMTSFSDLTLATSDDADNPLPVDMLYFEAFAANNQITLEWATAQELNNDYFEVHRSFDGSSYEPLGLVTGAGTTDEQQGYVFTDKNPVPGIQYYRLKQVDYDGAFEYSDIVVVEFAPNGSAFRASLFPNPMIGQEMTVELQTYDLTAPVTIAVMDIGGHMLLNQQFEIDATSQRFLLDVSHLKSGTYLIRIQQRDRVIVTKRAVMNR